ncbi:MAG TPA: caspase family protein, partial [Xanthobacteraceae bacterium]|nr:caspase family protein [Xanthobacteraceae bacterium]
MRRFRHVILLSSYVLLFVLLVHPVHAERRVAMVIGNGAYRHTSTLPNASIDAKAMAALLRNVGFDVAEGIDLKRDDMMTRLGEFATKIQGADVALLYYSGHGIAVDGKNYLVPVDIDVNSELDIKLGAAIDIEVAVDQIMADAKVKLVFLDACRDNPFTNKIRSAARTRSVTILSGLAEMKPSEGTLIAFAAGPGQTALDGKPGENSPFTRALLSNIAQPGVEIRHALTRVRAQVSKETNKGQLPWEDTNLTGFFYFNPQGATAAAPASTRAPGNPAAPSEARSNASTEIELEFWRSVRTSERTEEYLAYLARFPNGNF